MIVMCRLPRRLLGAMVLDDTSTKAEDSQGAMATWPPGAFYPGCIPIIRFTPVRASV